MSCLQATSSAPANNNRLLADIVHGPLTEAYGVSWSDPGGNVRSVGTEIRDSASVGPVTAFFQRADAMLIADRLTLVGASLFSVDPNPGAVVPCTIGFTLTSSVLSGGAVGIGQNPNPLITISDHHDNVFDGVATLYGGAALPGANEQVLQPGWDLATYGDGGYLIRPPALATAGAAGGPAGAEILYRTVDGALTTTPLWPWPLEDRILSEDGVSVTWESGGGIWRARPPVSCP